MKTLAATLALLFCGLAFAAEKLSVHLDNGKLVYERDELGGTIPDFSTCGYGGGGVELPAVPVKEIVEPSDGDAGARIQAALDKVGALALDANGIRGAVLLKKGEYKIAGTIHIKASGVVLRGEGEGEKDTVLIATGATQRTLVSAAGSGKVSEIKGSRQALAGTVVPCGARAIPLENASGFKAGDPVIVLRPCTQEWVHVLGMDKIPPRKDGGTVTQWSEGSEQLFFDRIVTKVEGNTLYLDAPIACALDKKYGGGFVYKYEAPERIARCGVENLRGVSEYKGNEDEKHGWVFVSFNEIENAWARGITSEHFGYACVSILSAAKWVTVDKCTCLDPISQITGGRRYSFNIEGQLSLVEHCHARNGRHDFVTGARVAGPNVFLDCSCEKVHADAGPHHRWAVGVLYDNIKTDGEINVRDRGNMGSGHGWAGANHVLWNCDAKEIICQRPPTANNWAIGCIVEKHEGNGTWESRGTHVQPRSLYLEQLAERQAGKGN